MFFFFNDTATTEIYTLSLHDALPISQSRPQGPGYADCMTWLFLALHLLLIAGFGLRILLRDDVRPDVRIDRKSTRLNSSHGYISYAVFCLKNKQNSVKYRLSHENPVY